MVKRRTLGEGLSPEEEAFLNPQKSSPPKQSKPTQKKKETDQMVKSATAAAVATVPQPPNATSPSLNFQTQIPSVGVMSLNTRISGEISTALLTASMQRKIQRLTPFTQQDIVSEALTDWLRKNGFL